MTSLPRLPGEAALLDLWEAGEPCQPLDRALLLLWAIGTAEPGDALADWTVGARDAALLRARSRLFGASFAATADCPECNERMGFDLDLDVLAEQATPAVPNAQVTCAGGRFRLPTSRDLAHAIGAAQPRHALALRCRIEGDALLDDATLDELDAACARADPAAQIDIELRCAACNARFTSLFDVADCLWSDVARRARQTLDDVHVLAGAYGWSEAEVLAVPPSRRSRTLRAATPQRLLNPMPASPRPAEARELPIEPTRSEVTGPNEFATQPSAHDPKPMASGASLAADSSPPPGTHRPALLQPQRRVQRPMAGIEHPSFATPPTPRVAGGRAAEASFAEAARATESVVHVSIGRVELTALVPPAATRPKAAPRQPATSLADYLRSDGSRSRK